MINLNEWTETSLTDQDEKKTNSKQHIYKTEGNYLDLNKDKHPLIVTIVLNNKTLGIYFRDVNGNNILKTKEGNTGELITREKNSQKDKSWRFHYIENGIIDIVKKNEFVKLITNYDCDRSVFAYIENLYDGNIYSFTFKTYARKINIASSRIVSYKTYCL